MKMEWPYKAMSDTDAVALGLAIVQKRCTGCTPEELATTAEALLAAEQEMVRDIQSRGDCVAAFSGPLYYPLIVFSAEWAHRVLARALEADRQNQERQGQKSDGELQSARGF
jgi:hypothetical protein